MREDSLRSNTDSVSFQRQATTSLAYGSIGAAQQSKKSLPWVAYWTVHVMITTVSGILLKLAWGFVYNIQGLCLEQAHFAQCYEQHCYDIDTGISCYSC